MWTEQQRQRFYLENESLKQEGLDQFAILWYQGADTYIASGWATSSSGKRYGLSTTLPPGFPNQRPALYITEPNPLLMADGNLLSSAGVSHNMHTLTPSSTGQIQICHWRDNRWHSGIMLYKVFLKALIWIEAYEQHLATGRPLAEFVRTMAE